MTKNLTYMAAAAFLAGGMAFAQSTTAPDPTAPSSPRAGARGAMRGRVLGGGMLPGRVLQALNLTEDQKTQAKTIFQQAHQTVKPIADQIRTNRQAIADAVKANDAVRIQQLAGTQGNLQGQATAIRAGALAKFYAILTPDQRAKAEQMRQQVQDRVQQRRERMQERLNRQKNG